MKKRYPALLICVVLIAALLTGCGGAAENSAAADRDYGYAMVETTSAAKEMLPETAMGGITTDSSLSEYSDPSAKLVKTVRLNAQTKEYDNLIPSIEEKITALGGYIEYRDSYNGSYYRDYDTRSCSMTIRVPADRLSEFVTHVSENANVTNSSESVENITLQYVDTASRVEALETEQTRLLELMETAANLSEILEIEARLSDIRYELESYASQLRVMDNQVAYATVHLSIDEVEKLTPVAEPTIWDRISSGFGNTIEDMAEFGEDLLVWTVANSPWLVLLALIATAAVLTFRRKAKKRKEKEPKPAENQE